ncbi:MAG TPA: glycosyltransferase, partial [Terriglobales bacterium]|nr:glycosyltransferase [Terriglobales bacterium]
MKVLISAYACEPGGGSEPELGWNWALHTAYMHETWVLTRSSNRQAIEAALGHSPRINFIYVDLPKWFRWWKKLPLGIYFYYYLWQLLSCVTAKRLNQKTQFDLIHHATFGTYWLPTFVALLPTPFVWGPVGGGETAPSAFFKSFSFRGKLYERTRKLAQRIAERDPLVRLTVHRAAIALATTSETANRLVELGCRNVHVFSQVGIRSDEIQSPASSTCKKSPTFRICSGGRLLHWKGFHLALRAVAQLQKQVPEIDYRIFGTGPERGRLEQLASELNISNRVTFVGHASRAELLKELADCDVLLHPSLHESGGLVCTEAMSVA